MKKDGKKRVWFLLIFCTAVFAAFLVRLYWMQFTMADHYAKKLEQASQTSYTVRIPAARGSIVDRSGTALVQDDTVYDLALCVPAPPDTEMAQTLQTLKELDLGGKDVETQLAAFFAAASAGVWDKSAFCSSFCKALSTVSTSVAPGAASRRGTVRRTAPSKPVFTSTRPSCPRSRSS